MKWSAIYKLRGVRPTPPWLPGRWPWNSKVVYPKLLNYNQFLFFFFNLNPPAIHIAQEALDGLESGLHHLSGLKTLTTEWRSAWQVSTRTDGALRNGLNSIKFRQRAFSSFISLETNSEKSPRLKLPSARPSPSSSPTRSLNFRVAEEPDALQLFQLRDSIFYAFLNYLRHEAGTSQAAGRPTRVEAPTSQPPGSLSVTDWTCFVGPPFPLPPLGPSSPLSGPLSPPCGCL